MKTSAEIQGLPIFSLVDGIEIGRVKQLVINPHAGQVELCLVDNEQNAIGVQVLPYTSVIGVGDFAMTVETGDAIQELSNVSGAREVILLGYKVIGTRVMSRRGQLLGHVTEYYVETETGAITACSFAETDDPASIKLFDRPNIMTFGRDVIVVKEEQQIFTSFADREAASAATEVAAAVAPVASDASETVADSNEAGEETTAPSAQVVAVGPYAYLVGKVLREDLRDEAGHLIAAQGSSVTPELIERVKNAGPTFFMKLNRLTGE